MLYLSLIGFCIGLGLIGDVLFDAIRNKRVAWAIVGLVLLLAIPVSWVQISPWEQGSRQSRQVVDELTHLLVPVPGRTDVNIVNLPRLYKGSYVFYNGLSDALAIYDQQGAVVHEVQDLGAAELQEPLTSTHGVYNIGFAFDPQTDLYHVSVVSATTSLVPPPEQSEKVWNYLACGPSLGWEVEEGSLACMRGKRLYAAFTPATSDSKMIANGLNIDLGHAQWVRIGVAIRLPGNYHGRLGQLFWVADNQSGWAEGRSRAFALEPTGNWQVYWIYLRANQVGKQLKGLRYDPVNDKIALSIQWIAIDVID